MDVAELDTESPKQRFERLFRETESSTAVEETLAMLDDFMADDRPPTRPQSSLIPQLDGNDDSNQDWRRVAVVRALELAEARFARKTSRYDCAGNLENSILLAIYDNPRSTHKQILQKLECSDNQRAWKMIDTLIERKIVKVEELTKHGYSKRLKVLSLAGIPYCGEVHSLRDLAAHRDNSLMHGSGNELSMRTIHQRLKAGLSPTLALLRPAQRGKKW